MTKRFDKNVPVMTQIRRLEAGEMVAIPFGAGKVRSVQSNLSSFALDWGRKYSTHINREKGCLEVTRKS